MTGPGRFDFRSPADLLEKAAELGFRIPFSEDIGILLKPVTLSGQTLKNRLAIHPLEGADAAPDGGPGEWTFRRYERFAQGGSGMIWFEAASVVPEGRSNPRQLRLTATNLDEFKRLVERTRTAARKGDDRERPDPFLILQLTHSGRFAKPEGTPAPVVSRRDPILDSFLPSGAQPTIASDDDLQALGEAFVEAARLASFAGFDGVDIKACHGYLLAELLSGFAREGRFGGTYENRTRLLREIVSEIRTAVPKLSVSVRLNVWDGFPHPSGFGADPGFPDRENATEPLRLATDLTENKVDFLNVSAGIPHYLPHIGRPFDQPVRGGGPSPEHPLAGVSRLLRLAGIIQSGIPFLPVVGTGYSWLRFLFPQVAAAIVSSGQASLIGLGRLAFAYPDFVRDLETDGRLNPRKICTACSGCSTLLRAARPVGCVVRDAGIYKI
jgi:2,4-dienoyl-CoA reductase-like NADH-dependent reductase (Old Yellow Enzyme family)